MTENIESYESFDDMGLSDDLLRGIYSLGFEFPSKIQQKAIVPLSKGNNIIAQSQSGTGKTGTFSIGSLQVVDKDIKQPQVLILSPTRELAQQTYNVASDLNRYLNYSITLLVGGKNINSDFKSLDNGSQIVIGCPGRVYDMLKRFALKSDKLKLLVIDEADEMLSRGFKEQIYEILHFIPDSCRPEPSATVACWTWSWSRGRRRLARGSARLHPRRRHYHYYWPRYPRHSHGQSQGHEKKVRHWHRPRPWRI